MYFWERRNEIRVSVEKSAGCGILVKKERECGIRTPLPDPVQYHLTAIGNSFTRTFSLESKHYDLSLCYLYRGMMLT